MIEQQGKVVVIANDKAGVLLGGDSGCARCAAGKGCGAGIFGRLMKRQPVVLELENRVGAEKDQPVMVGIPETLFLRFVLKLYLFPLLAALTAAALGYYLALSAGWGAVVSDMVTLLCGLVGGAVALLYNRHAAREFPESTTVHLLRVIEICEPGK